MHARLVAVVALTLVGCGPRITTIGENVDAGPPATATLTGQACTQVPDPSGFPVKLVVLLDQSGSNCITDPPGSLQSPGLCEMVAVPPGITQPARVRALNKLLDTVETQPNVQLTLVPFDINVKGVWPPPFSGGFARPDATLRNRVNTLQAELGKASDVQGALEYAFGLVGSDVVNTEAFAPEILPQTRYVVVLITDGPPMPRCSRNDSLQAYADDEDPRGVWPDTDPDFCNLIDPMDPDAITGFLAGSDRNQDGQLVTVVEQLRRLARDHHVGDIRFSSILMTNEEALTTCGPICQDLFGMKTRWPGPVPVSNGAAFAYVEARSLLTQLSTVGGGSFTEYSNFSGLSTFAMAGLMGIDLGTLASENQQRVLFPQPLRATAWQGAWEVDQDGDGLPDGVETAEGTSPLLADTDGDGFDDTFERAHTAQGFDPLVRDARGCDPLAPATPNCVTRDTDGDGVSQFAERFLGTRETFADDDRDGLPDGLEVRWGLDPTVPIDPTVDSDGDGVTDFAEVLQATDPHFADAALRGISVTSTTRTQPNGSNCYDFRVTGLPMVNVPAATGPVPPGVNLFKLWFAEAPELAPESPGVWSAACIFARRDLSQSTPILVPANLEGTLFPTDFVPPYQLVGVGTEARCAQQSALLP